MADFGNFQQCMDSVVYKDDGDFFFRVSSSSEISTLGAQTKNHHEVFFWRLPSSLCKLQTIIDNVIFIFRVSTASRICVSLSLKNRKDSLQPEKV